MRICPQCRTQTEESTCPNDGFQTVDASRYDLEDDEDKYIGTVFEGRYKVIDLLGEGGMGAVYLADQLAVGRKVALKIMKSELANRLTEVARFQQEARAIASLSHVNIISLIDFGQAEDGSLFLVMEFLEGEPLDEVIGEQAPIEPARIVHIAQQVLDALGQAHGQGIVHRDLKPENLFLTKMGRTSDFVKVLDFGIAKVTGDASAGMTLTGTGMAIGSPRYMAPEQCMGQSVTPQADLYALGCIMYEMLTGRPVFLKESATEYLFAHVREEPDIPVKDGMQLGGPLVSLILHCLQKAPASRPAGTVQALEMLEACGDSPVTTSETAAVAPLLGSMATMAAPGITTDGGTPAAQAVSTGIGSGLQQAGTAPGTGVQASMAAGTGLQTAGAAAAPSTGLVAQPGSGAASPPSAISTALRPAGEGTSLSGSELDLSAYQPKPFPMWAALAAVLVLGGLGAGAFFVLGGSGGGDETPAEAGLVSAAKESATAETEETPKTEGGQAADAPKVGEGLEDAPKAALAAGEAKGEEAGHELHMVGVWVATVPSGAELWIGEHNQGTTPLEVKWPFGTDAPKVVLKRAGHLDHEFTLKQSKDGAPMTVELEATKKVKKPTATAKKAKPTKPPATKPAPAKPAVKPKTVAAEKPKAVIPKPPPPKPKKPSTDSVFEEWNDPVPAKKKVDKNKKPPKAKTPAPKKKGPAKKKKYKLLGE